MESENYHIRAYVLFIQHIEVHHAPKQAILNPQGHDNLRTPSHTNLLEILLHKTLYRIPNEQSEVKGKPIMVIVCLTSTK